MRPPIAPMGFAGRLGGWLHWCADTRTDPVLGCTADLAGFVLDELGRGTPDVDVASGLEAAGALTGLWRTSERHVAARARRPCRGLRQSAEARGRVHCVSGPGRRHAPLRCPVWRASAAHRALAIMLCSWEHQLPSTTGRCPSRWSVH